jgi:hypothetical protein
LLAVFLTKEGFGGLDGVEEFGDDGGDTAEEVGADFAFAGCFPCPFQVVGELKKKKREIDILLLKAKMGNARCGFLDICMEM